MTTLRIPVVRLEVTVDAAFINVNYSLLSSKSNSKSHRNLNSLSNILRSDRSRVKNFGTLASKP